MKLYIITGHIIDFNNENYQLFEPTLCTSPEEAESVAVELLQDELDRYGEDDDYTQERKEVGDNGYDHNFTVSDHEGRLFEMYVRQLEI